MGFTYPCSYSTVTAEMSMCGRHGRQCHQADHMPLKHLNVEHIDYGTEGYQHEKTPLEHKDSLQPPQPPSSRRASLLDRILGGKGEDQIR